MLIAIFATIFNLLRLTATNDGRLIRNAPFRKERGQIPFGANFEYLAARATRGENVYSSLTGRHSSD